MKYKFLSKLVLGVLIASTLVGGLTRVSYAISVESVQAVDGDKKIEGQIDISDLDSSDTVLSEVMTLDEMIQDIANINNISVDEVRDRVLSNLTREGYSISPYATFRKLTSTITINSRYKPRLQFYCQTDEWSGSFRAIVKILNVDLIRSYNGNVKQFSGNIYTNLEDPNRIYWSINGDFYNYGQTNYNGEVNIGLGGFANINFGVSGGNGFYGYIYKDGYMRF